MLLGIAKKAISRNGNFHVPLIFGGVTTVDSIGILLGWASPAIGIKHIAAGYVTPFPVFYAVASTTDDLDLTLQGKNDKVEVLVLVA